MKVLAGVRIERQKERNVRASLGLPLGALRGSPLGLSVIGISKPSGYQWGQWQEKDGITGKRLHLQEPEDELATPFVVPSRGAPSPKMKTGPSPILPPFSF